MRGVLVAKNLLGIGGGTRPIGAYPVNLGWGCWWVGLRVRLSCAAYVLRCVGSYLSNIIIR